MAELGRVVIVANRDDGVKAARHVARLGGPEHGRLVVRPTPGTGFGDPRDVLAQDLLMALGKNPVVVKDERPGPAAFDLARAWLAAAGVRDIVVDRAHLQPVDRLADVAALAVENGARTWLMWGSDQSARPVAAKLTAAGHVVQVAGWHEMAFALPPVATDRPQEVRDERRLPDSDFAWFLADCRRLLPKPVFAQVAAEFHAAAERAEDWIEARADAVTTEYLPVQRRPPVGAQLTTWLRDAQIGPAPSPAAALIALRATQAALFLRGVLLTWNRSTLGPDPARRLLSSLTSGNTRALAGMCRTDPAAATALSLHLCVPPLLFDCWTIGDVTPDGSHLAEPAVHRHPLTSGINPDSAYTSGRMDELGCAAPIQLPPPAARLLAPHLAWRRQHGATDDDRLFVHPDKPGERTVTKLRPAVARTATRINAEAPWLHSNDCRYGADVGLRRRTHGWMTHRGLTAHPLDDAIVANLPRRPRPAWRTR